MHQDNNNSAQIVSWSMLNTPEQIKKAVDNSFPSKNGLKWTEILFLSRSESFYTNQKNFEDYWYLSYGINDPTELLNQLNDMGFITPEPLEDSIKKLTTAEIKEKLKYFALKVSGKKQELINRLLTNVSMVDLEKYIAKRYYKLTDLGNSEIKQNEYVFQFGYYNRSNLYGFDIWWLNAKIYENPTMNYRDLIWGELNKQSIIAKEKFNDGYFYEYIRIREIMAQFLLDEKKNYKTALSLLAEAYYIYGNTEAINSFIVSRNHKNHFTDTSSTNLGYNDSFNEYFKIEINALSQIQTSLNYSDDELFKKIITILNKYSIDKEYISKADIAGYMVSSINGDIDQISILSEMIEESLINQHIIPKPPTQHKKVYSYNQLVLLNFAGQEHEKNGEIEKAIQCYETVIEQTFNGNHPYDRLATIYHNLQDDAV